MKTVLLKSIGCRTNQVEMAGLGSELISRGYTLVKNYAEAEVIIINTCSVTRNTEAKVKRLIASWAKKYPTVKILVTGCLAQQMPREMAKIAGVWWVAGNRHKNEISDLLASPKKRVVCAPVHDGQSPVETFCGQKFSVKDAARTRFHLKIQEGCDFRCGYCIVPVLRGPSRSVPKTDVIRTCVNAVRGGYKELVLTGTHIGQYDCGGGYRLGDLVDDILSVDGDFRIRLSSLDPRDCSDGLLRRIEEEGRVCKHLHLSVQSLSRQVMAGMNRLFPAYDRFLDRLIAFKERNPRVGLGGDFIVGFPGETEAMFEETCDMVRKIGFNYGHVFRYSMRPGTEAAAMKNQVHGRVKIKRSTDLRKCLLSLRKLFIREQIGTVQHRIIVESEKPVRGITSNYIRVRAPEIKAGHNSWCDVVLREYDRENNWCIAVSAGKG